VTVEQELTSLRFAQERSFIGRPIAPARTRDLHLSTRSLDGDLEWRDVSLGAAKRPTGNDQKNRDNDEQHLTSHVWPPSRYDNIPGGVVVIAQTPSSFLNGISQLAVASSRSTCLCFLYSPLHLVHPVA
jgi:hypothetical protein